MSSIDRRRNRGTHLGMFVLGTATLIAVSGCGGASGEGEVQQARADASGTVTFDGKPIPAGSVVFTHLETGTYSTCPIDDGEYENDSGDGPVLGRNSVGIVGLDSEGGKPLWSGAWSREVTIEGDSFSENFDVKSADVQPYKDIGMDEEAPLY